MRDDQELPVYTAEMFASPTDECDIVMKGGVTSGIVYPYAILELARRYRFCSVGGTPLVPSQPRWQPRRNMRVQCAVTLPGSSACKTTATDYPSA